MSSPPHDDDQVRDEVPGASLKKTGDVQEVNEKTGAFIDSKADNDGVDYSSDDFGEGRTRPIETAEDLVSKIIHVEDDKTLNPITFRTIFLGKCDFPRRRECLYSHLPRNWSLHLRCCLAGDLLLQAADHFCLPRVSDRYRLCPRRLHGRRNPAQGCSPLLEPRTV